MNVLLDPIGFIADSIAIANALGFQTPAQAERDKKILSGIDATLEATDDLRKQVEEHVVKITSSITTASVIEVRSRVEDVESVSGEKLELLIKLLFCIKECAPNVVFAIIAKYKARNTTATLGFAASSSDAIETTVKQVDDFARSLKQVKKEKTAYVNVRIRGKYQSTVENFCAAALTKVAADVCGLSNNIDFASVLHCPLEVIGTKTRVLLQPAEYEDERSDYDRLCRVFLVGDTRTGKSTLGNAFLNQDVFHISRGMTGTMRIQRGERVEEIDKELWVTEVYDTPGLNDKDGLDLLYETAIEDHIRVLQRASTLIMTVGVDAGITHSAFDSLASYKALFGSSIASMLIVVLTVNGPSELEDLQDCLELNWPTITKLDGGISKRNVFCVSLHDLRSNTKTASHVVLEEIISVCRGMPLKIIESLALRYRELREVLQKKTGDLEKTVQSLIDEGWQKYDNITELYEQSDYVKMTDGMIDGFVMKKTNAKRKTMAMLSAGLVNVIRKTAVHVYFRGKNASRAWDQFYNKHMYQNSNANLMRKLGDYLYGLGLAIMVNNMGVTFVGTLRVMRYCVTIFDPVNQVYSELCEHLHDVVTEKCDGLRSELVNDLIRSVIPPAVRYKAQGSRKPVKEKTAFAKQAVETLFPKSSN